MTMRRSLLPCLLFAFAVAPTACSSSRAADDSSSLEEGDDLANWTNSFGVIPENFFKPDKIPSAKTIELGKKIFYDTNLSLQTSCAECHKLTTYGTTGQRVTISGPNSRTRDIPTILNAAGYEYLTWEGLEKTIEQKAGESLVDPNELGVADDATLEAKFIKLGYGPLTRYAAGEALGAYVRTLATRRSRFDQYLAGDRSALTDEEVAGGRAFVKSGCATCHGGSSFGANNLSKMGVAKIWTDTTDLGRFSTTGDAKDVGLFRSPSLRNVAETGPYLHDGSVQTVEQAVRLMSEYQVKTPLKDEEIAPVVAFLKTLTGKPPTENP